jgi:hypothetical protein
MRETDCPAYKNVRKRVFPMLTTPRFEPMNKRACFRYRFDLCDCLIHFGIFRILDLTCYQVHVSEMSI